MQQVLLQSENFSIFPFLNFSVSEGIQVRYGKTKEMDKTQTKYTVKTYKASDMCEAPANTTGFWDPGYIYDVLLTDLEPNTRYYYSCGTEEVKHRSKNVHSSHHDFKCFAIKA